jgi:hypothetical protein
MNSEYFEIYTDDDGVVDTKLTLTSEGFESVSVALEEILKELTGVEIICPESNELCAIREQFLDLLETIANNTGEKA